MRPVPVIGDFAFVPVTWWIVVIAVAGALTALLVISRRRLRRDDAEPAAWRAWWRRLAIVVVIVLAMAGPAVRGSEAINVSNVEIYMVVDRTGSMAAEDYQGEAPEGTDPAAAPTRLDGVRSDMRAIREAFPDSRFSIIALDDAAATELPLTHDTNAVDSWIGSLKQEVTAHATGSSLEVALPLLAQSLLQSHQSDPNDIRLVYILSDGEATDDGRGAQEADSAGISWGSLAGVVDGGAVLGYGTADGGRMRSYDGSTGTGEHTQSDYITDGEGGQPGVSKIDEKELQGVAEAMGIPYFHRTGGSGDDPTSKFTDLDIEAITSDGRAKTNVRVYMTWPLGLIAFGLLLWEIIDLIRADRRLRLLAGRRRRS